jgi:beta-phosphoglucomutase family hydrolase
MTLKAVLFDMDGVIVDNLPYHVEAWLLFCNRNGIALTKEVFYKELNGMNSKDTFEWFYKKEMTRAEVEVLEEEKELLYREFYAQHRKPAKGLLTFLHDLRSRGIKTALATSAGPGNIDFIVDGLGIRDQFDAIIGGAEVTKGKPDPEIYVKAAALVGVSPADCLVIEDSLQGIASGQAAGARVVGITTSHSAEELAHTDFCAPDFTDLYDQLTHL